MTTLTIIGNVTNSRTSYFQNAIVLNEESLAYEVLQSVLGNDFYPENADTEWTDILVKDGKYFACFGEDSLMTDTSLTYVQVEPTKSMIDAYNYSLTY